MPNFHQTGLGRAFFGRQLPELIKGINRLADAVDKGNIKIDDSSVNEDIVFTLTKKDIEMLLREKMSEAYLDNLSEDEFEEILAKASKKLDTRWVDCLEDIA